MKVKELASLTGEVIREKELPWSGFCREWCVAILLLATDAEDYSLLFADESTTEDTGNCVLGAECHFWLVSKTTGDVIDPTARQFTDAGVPLPYHYLEDEEVREVQSLSPTICEAAQTYVSYLKERV